MDRRRTTRLPLWAALALGGLLFAGAAPPAAASCGDYVHVLPPGQTAAQPGEPTPPAPCSGPGCRQAPSAPIPAPPPAPTSVQPHEAILTAPPPPAPPGGARSHSEPSLSPRRAATAIFHPPRA
jgi:hypothetical protein